MEDNNFILERESYLRKMILSIEWDFPNIKNKETISRKKGLLEKYKSELANLANCLHNPQIAGEEVVKNGMQ
jgi:hypothetical protein